MNGDSQGASYKDIIFNGDYINRAIFTQTEFEGGLCRLTKEELVVEVHDKIYPTPKALKLLSIAKDAGSETVQDVSKSIESSLGVLPYGSKQTEIHECSFQGFSAEKFEEAVTEYQRELKEAFS